jgi:hypothetical protein
MGRRKPWTSGPELFRFFMMKWPPTLSNLGIGDIFLPL